MIFTRPVRVLAWCILAGLAAALADPVAVGGAAAASGSGSGSVVFDSLYGVSCPSVTFCVAVGTLYGTAHDPAQTLVEMWRGGTWRAVASPDTSAAEDNELYAVSCTGPSFCMAAGYARRGSGGYGTLIVRWNGTAWAIVSSPNSGSRDNYLSGLSCSSPSFCAAVGQHDGANGNPQPLNESWNGAQWALGTSPTPAPPAFNDLRSVSCTSAAFCAAVGSHYTGSGMTTLAERWNGTAWAVVSSPNPPGPVYNNLYGVSCTGPTSCMAAGYGTNGYEDRTLTERWDGTRWTVVSSPDTSPTQYDDLLGIGCVPSFCAAAGYYYGRVAETLVEHWNGASWRIVSSPNAPRPDSSLGAVSCATSSLCMAVGYSSFEPGNNTLVIKWNGTTWNLMTSPNP
jgi:hypothetical protein